MPYRYESISDSKIQNVKSKYFGETYKSVNIYPDIEPTEQDFYVITVMGDRLDLLAYDFYGDPSLWWIIASANALPGDSLFPPIGAQLRIPADARTAYNQYRFYNTNR
jgi:hypothetical protein